MPLTGRWRGEKTFCGTVGAGKCILSEKTRRAPELHSGLKLFRVWPRGCSVLRRSCCVLTRRRRRGLILGGGDVIRDALREGRRQDGKHEKALTQAWQGRGTGDGQGQRGSVRTANARREKGGNGAHDGQIRMMKRGRAVRKLRVERRIKNGLRMLTQAAVSPQRRRIISASSGKQIPVPRQDADSDARGSCARSARWRPSGDRCIHGRACRTRLLFCRCGGDSRS